MVTHIRVSLATISPPKADEAVIHGVFGHGGSIDCSSHPRARVHPGEDSFYRTDKRMHFLSSQVVCNPTGQIMRLTIARGHNNDQGLFNMSEMAAWIEQKNVGPLLADLGYTSSDQVITPFGNEERWRNEGDARSMASLNLTQTRARVIVENVNSWFKSWKFAENKCHFDPEFQAMALIVCGMLTNIACRKLFAQKALSLALNQDVSN